MAANRFAPGCNCCTPCYWDFGGADPATKVARVTISGFRTSPGRVQWENLSATFDVPFNAATGGCHWSWFGSTGVTLNIETTVGGCSTAWNSTEAQDVLVDYYASSCGALSNTMSVELISSTGTSPIWTCALDVLTGSVSLCDALPHEGEVAVEFV